MKHLIWIVISLSILSCTEDPNEIFNAERNTFVGKWQIQIDKKIYRSDTLYFSVNSIKEITFLVDGGGEIDQGIFGIERIEWIYQFDPERIFITTYSNFNVLLQYFYLFIIEENSVNSQKWIYEKDQFNFSDSTTEHVVETWILTRP